MNHLDMRVRALAARCLPVLLSCVLAGCGDEQTRSEPIPAPGSPDAETRPSASVSMGLESPAFEARAPIPTRHTGEGPDLSPPLRWRGVPDGTKQLVLICDDPDAPRPTPWVHWVLYGLPPGASELAEGDSGSGIEGVNDFGRPGWGGPMPPKGHGIHHYHFKLYAIDIDEPWPAGLKKDELLERIDGHVLAQAELVGTYER